MQAKIIFEDKNGSIVMRVEFDPPLDEHRTEQDSPAQFKALKLIEEITRKNS